jgi:hypothetical protein
LRFDFTEFGEVRAVLLLRLPQPRPLQQLLPLLLHLRPPQFPHPLHSLLAAASIWSAMCWCWAASA